MKRISSAVFALLTIVAITPYQAFAERKLYSTLIKGRAEGHNFTGGVWAAIQRITLTFKNISPVSQRVTIRIADMSTSIEAAFETIPIANVNLMAWNQDPTYQMWRNKVVVASPNSATETIVIPANGAHEIAWSVKCEYHDSARCTFQHGEPVMVANLNVREAVFTNKFSVELTVDEDRGALLADLHVQTVVAGQGDTAQENETRPLNGGRPF